MSKFSAEFKINNKWISGELLDINLDEQKYIITHNNQIIEVNNKTLQLHFPKILLKNPEYGFKKHEKVEFYNPNEKVWEIGEIKAIKGDFYLISYITGALTFHSKIFPFNLIRPVTPDKEITILNLEKCYKHSLDGFRNLASPLKSIQTLIDKLRKLFTCNEIETFFYSKFNLYSFVNDKDLKDINELISNMVALSLEHFIEIDTENLNTNNNLQGSPLKEGREAKKNEKKLYTKEIVIDKGIYEMQKQKLKNIAVKIEVKSTKNQGEICLLLKAKDEKTWKDAVEITDLVQKYWTVPISEKDSFFKEESLGKTVNYYIKWYDIQSFNKFKFDDNSTTLRVIGKREDVEFFEDTIKEYFESQERKRSKLNEVLKIKKQILNNS